jgi:hypothetical protein
MLAEGDERLAVEHGVFESTPHEGDVFAGETISFECRVTYTPTVGDPVVLKARKPSDAVRALAVFLGDRGREVAP